MNIYGVEITKAQEEACVESMKIGGLFKAIDIQEVAIRNGVPQWIEAKDGLHQQNPVAMRFADRLIQRERKAGNIVFSKGEWSWVRR